jgi:predicted deacylase
VAAGTTLGRITDYVGRPLTELRATAAGVVLYVRAVPTVNKGDAVASIGVVGKAPDSMGTKR